MAASENGGDEFADLDVGAIPFITVDDDEGGKFVVHPEAVKYLESLEGRIALVSIAGIYRTGKSYLLNMLMGKAGGFKVGSTVRACTKGIWIWGRAIKLEDSDLTVVFMDTEGLGSTVRSATYDCRVFALALLLSSYFIYNSVGTIDGNAISKLSLVVNLTKHIHVRSTTSEEDSGTEYNQFFPHFLWVVRDFTVKLERNGRKISSRDYLEDSLRPEDGMSEAVESKNAIRMLLRNFFPERDCITMVRPVSEEDQLQHLSDIPFDSLRPEFQHQVELLRKRVFSAVRPKTMYGRPLNGAMISNLAATYAQALNENKAPTISTAWDRVVDKQCQEAVEKALERYMKAMRDAVAQTEPRTWTSAEGKEEMVQVLEAGDVHQTHDGSRQLALDVFKKEAVQDEQRLPPFETALTDGLRERLIKFVRQNEGNSARLCQGVLHQLIDDLRSGLQSSLATMRDAAKAEGGGGGGGDDSAGEGIGFGTVMEQYRMHLERLQETYAKRAGGPAKDSALCAALVEHVPPVLSEAADLVSQGHQRQLRELRRQMRDKDQELSQAQGRERTAQQMLEQEKANFERTIAESSRAAADKSAQLQATIDARSEEVERQSAKLDRMMQLNDTQAARFDERIETIRSTTTELREELKEAREKLEAKVDEAALLSRRLAEAAEKTASHEQEKAALQQELHEAMKEVAVCEERVTAAQNETIRLREQTELLYESVKVQKDLLQAKQEEKEECEYQWGAVKAELAQTESEKLSLQAEINTLENIARQMKAILTQSKLVKRMTMDGLERRRFDDL